MLDPLACTDCTRDLNRFNPICVGCGGRYLRDIQKRVMTRDAKVTWLRAVLADWMRFGHPEQELRDRAKGIPHAVKRRTRSV